MIISIWRYSHLVLAVSSFVFIAIASLTGIILSFEPISNQMQEYGVDGAGELSLAKALPQLSSSYEEIFHIEVDANGFVIISGIDKEGNMEGSYIDPFTGEKLGELIDQSTLFEFATTLHRSLFLKGPGRFFVGLSSFLLLLITVTGTILVVKRQQGIRYFFNKIIRDNFYQYYHVYLGRLALVPIIIIALTGTYFSLLRFEIIPENINASYPIDFDSAAAKPAIGPENFTIFKNTALSEIRSLEFPFSEDIEDFYTLKLKNKELIINQFTGEVLAEHPYPLVTLLSDLSLTLHTGRGSIWWSIILGLASCSTLFFIYSGFNITFKRRSTRIKNQLGKDDCEFIILIGSETGSTIPFAMQLHLHLLELGKSSYITEMNRYSTFKKLQHLIIVTSTYGLGEAPANASGFIELFKNNRPDRRFTYSVVGFGSLAYADFCQYAFDVDDLLLQDKNSTRLLEVYTINNRSWEAYRQWARQWAEKSGLKLELPAKNPVVHKNKKKEIFEVIDKTPASESPDNTFLMKLRPNKYKKFKSGDLLAIYPPDDPHERLYSMAVTTENDILLSVKKHKKGVCSNYLDTLKKGETLTGSIVKNKNFHFPSRASRVVMISTGTGIAPFLGMLMQKTAGVTHTHLYWGGRNKQSLEIYKHYIEAGLTQNKLNNFVPAYSRLAEEEEKNYVQHLIARDKELIAQTLKENGVIMLCGSIAMQREVIDILEQITTELTGKPLSYYQNKSRLRMDCY